MVGFAQGNSWASAEFDYLCAFGGEFSQLRTLRDWSLLVGWEAAQPSRKITGLRFFVLSSASNSSTLRDSPKASVLKLRLFLFRGRIFSRDWPIGRAAVFQMKLIFLFTALTWPAHAFHAIVHAPSRAVSGIANFYVNHIQRPERPDLKQYDPPRPDKR